MNKKLRVLIVDDDPDRGASVETCLIEKGFETVLAVSGHINVLKEISTAQPDVIVIEMASPGRDILESLAVVSTHQPTPILMFSSEEDPDFINRAVDAGVTAYINGELDADKVKPAIDAAMAQFRAFQKLHTQLSETRSLLEDSLIIEKAKRHIMQELKLDEEAAYQQLRSTAMKQQIKIAELAATILNNGKHT